VAFDLLWAPDAAAPRVVVTNPRGAGFRGPALAQALFVADAMLGVGKLAERRGRLFVLDRALERLLLAALPPLGVRAPALGRATLGELQWKAGAPTVRAAQDLAAELPEPTVRALALADLLVDADDCLSSADPEGARAAYLTALERAPRHPEICQLVASIDGEFADRTEASLGLLVESLPITAFGLLGAELLARTGDRLGAELAVSKQIEHEPYAPLAALALVRLSELCGDSVARLDHLDRALAVCPRCSPARWARLEGRLLVSDVHGAVSDAEHLEAATRGSRERYEVLLAAAERVRDAGFLSAAGRLFERALRYVPKEGRAALGLAECLIATGREGRALPLVNRAVDDEDEATQSRACLVLARLLATVYRDLPQAIARAQRVTAARPSDAIEARALEARWREQLGDVTGARMAHGRVHDLVSAHRDVDARMSAQHLLEAARFSMDVARDAHSAHRHVALALRLEPKDARVQRRYRELSEVVGSLSEAGERANPALPRGSEGAASDLPPEG
jgi:tetratricopeptide (TPR) repeat protein